MDKLSQILKAGGVAVIPTDTIYGIVGSALNKETVQKIYTLRKRQPSKPFIILISSLEDLKLFNVTLTSDLQALLSTLWPNKVSVILPCENKQFEYLHRGTNSLAFRLPDKKDLIELLKKTGPLVAPSANPEGEKEAKTVSEAKDYFGDSVYRYSDAGTLQSLPSTLVKITNGKLEVLRQGAVDLASN